MSQLSTPAIETRACVPYAGVRVTVAMETLATELPKHWPATFAWLASQGHEPAGAPFIRYRRIQMPDKLEIDIAIPTATLLRGDDTIVTDQLPAGDYAVAYHQGNFDTLDQSNAALQDWGDAQGVAWDTITDADTEQWTSRIESYLSDPDTEPDPSKWVTELAYKIA